MYIFSEKIQFTEMTSLWKPKTLKWTEDANQVFSNLKEWVMSVPPS